MAGRVVCSIAHLRRLISRFDGSYFVFRIVVSWPLVVVIAFPFGLASAILNKSGGESKGSEEKKSFSIRAHIHRIFMLFAQNHRIIPPILLELPEPMKLDYVIAHESFPDFESSKESFRRFPGSNYITNFIF